MTLAAVPTGPLAIPLTRALHRRAGVQCGADLVLSAVETDEGVVGHGTSISEDREGPGALASSFPGARVRDDVDVTASPRQGVYPSLAR